MSLRVRLTLSFLLLAAPVLALFGGAVYLVSRDRLYAGVDRSLTDRAENVRSAIQRTEGPLTPADIDVSRRSLDRLALDEGASFEVLDLDFRLLYSSKGGFTDFGRPGGVSSGREFITADADGNRLRVLTTPLVYIGEPVGYLEAATSLRLVDSSLSRISQVIVAGGVLVLLVTALPAYVIAGRAIDPVRKVSRLARELEETADFSRRLAAGGATGETKELVETFNRMVARVEKMMLAQRAFLAESSHELRRPLTLLRTNIDVINDPGLTESDRRLIESEMRDEAEAMSRLIANLVLLAREGQVAFAFSPTDLSQLCRRLVREAGISYPQRRFFCEADAEVWASLDEERFAQAIANLLHNAAAYSPEDGIVCLSLRRRDGSAEIEVLDYGCGMSQADVEHAFDRFYRGSSARENRTEGFGLGLAIVRHVVEAHGGEVSLASRLGEGTRVRVTLPVCEPSGVVHAATASR